MTALTQAVSDLPVLTAEECAAVRQTIMSLRANWIKRHPALPFYTLGAASYLDAAASLSNYHSLAHSYNPILKDNFSSLYSQVASVMERHLGEPVTFADNLALPGFHIYLSSKAFEKPMASIHCDSQYLLHDWSQRSADLHNPISFTLSIALPKNGGGLNTWDVEYAQVLAAGGNLAGLIKNRDVAFHPYRAGHMALHSGHVLHQAAPGIDIHPEDERITLQGHAVAADGFWQLYW